MNVPFTRVAASAAALVALGFSGAAQAQSAGQWMLRVGATHIAPSVTSGDLTAPSLAGTKADVHANTQLGGGVTYMLTDHVSVDVPLAMPFKHELVGDGAIAGVGRLGTVKALPITVTLQYRFLEPTSQFRPYAGIGLTYAKFYKERGTAVLSAITGGLPSNPTTLKVDSKFALTPEIGVSVRINERMFVNLSYQKTFLKTRNTLSTGQTLDIKLDPDTFAIAVGYTF